MAAIGLGGIIKKLLAVFSQFSYGDPQREESYEYVHFFDSFKQMGLEVELFDSLRELKSRGREEMNLEFLRRLDSYRPEICFFSLTNDEFSEETIAKARSICKTVCFFHDDTWRVEYSRHWAKQFDFFTTPDPHGVQKYAELGLKNAFFLPFGCNLKAFRSSSGPKDIDVSFVGAWHPYREYLIKRLRKNGVSVKVAGFGWKERSSIMHSEMIDLFQRSKISLNLSNSTQWDFRYMLSSPRGAWNNLRSKKSIEQIKGRLFEVPACGTGLVTYYVEGLDLLFDRNSEIVIFENPGELVDQVKGLLGDPVRLAQLTSRGQARVQRDHSYTQRFSELFKNCI